MTLDFPSLHRQCVDLVLTLLQDVDVIVGEDFVDGVQLLLLFLSSLHGDFSCVPFAGSFLTLC